MPGVAKYQIVQTDIDRVEVKMVLDKGGGFPADGVARIRAGIAARLGVDVRIDVTPVDSIAEDPSGKFRYVISKVAQQRQGPWRENL